MKKLYLKLEEIPALFFPLLLIIVCLLSIIFLHPRFINVWNQEHQSGLLSLFIANTIKNQGMSLSEYFYLRDMTSTNSVEYNSNILKPHSILKFEDIQQPKSDLLTFESKNFRSQESLVQAKYLQTFIENEIDQAYQVIFKTDRALLMQRAEPRHYILLSIHTFDEFQAHQGLIDFEGIKGVLHPEEWLWVIRAEVGTN